MNSVSTVDLESLSLPKVGGDDLPQIDSRFVGRVRLVAAGEKKWVRAIGPFITTEGSVLGLFNAALIVFRVKAPYACVAVESEIYDLCSPNIDAIAKVWTDPTTLKEGEWITFATEVSRSDL